MAKYGPKAQATVERALHEEKRGQLKSGSGKKVTSRKQAIAIGLAEARRDGAEVPQSPTASGAKKRSTKKTAAKKKSSARKKSSSSCARS